MESNRVPPYSIQEMELFNANAWENNYTQNNILTDPVKASKVHVNPNFKNGKSLVIHVNPKIYQNRKIHVNPKIMKDMVPVNEEKIPDVSTDKVSKIEEKKIQKSIHVNRNLVKKLVDEKKSPVQNKTREIPIAHDNIPKPSTPRLLAISKRKLVTIGSSCKNITTVQSPNSLKRLNKKLLSVVRVNSKKSISLPGRTKFSPAKNKYKLNAYKIDRTAVQRKKKKTCIPDARIRNISKGLVAIGGVMYQSSRTQLVRSDASSSAQKRKNSAVNSKGDTFVMARNGKKLLRLNSGKEGSSVTRYVITRNSVSSRSVFKKVPNAIVQTSHKNVISYKAKQRSLQILRDKLRKNYIPCLLFRRFGFCAKQAKGTCPKLHDKKQVALCKNFLQGKCLLDNCPLSHDIGPEKMPTCKYFLEGCCIRDSCPYLHVKVSSKTPVCAQFLRGYCVDGNKCKQRHIYICPEYEKSGTCKKGKYCPYPHKLKPSMDSIAKNKIGKNIRGSSSNKQISNTVSSKIVRKNDDSNRKRYYDDSLTSDKELAEMRKNILNQKNFVKANDNNINEICDKVINNCDDTTINDNLEENDCDSDERPKRTPIGPLPAYIPID